jgi:hypothetical protein
MALDIKQHAPTDRPVIASGRSGTSDLPALVEEVDPLMIEALGLPKDKALPVTVPTDQASDLVRALRAAGEKAGVTVRFKRFPRLDDDGNRVMTVPKDGSDKESKPLSDPFEYTNKAKSTVRVTFWTSKKVERKSKQETARETVNPAD